MLARLRVVDGDPAFEVLVPFAVDGGPTVLVDRGYVRPAAGSQVPAYRRRPRGHGDDHRAAAQLRGRRRGKDPFRAGRRAAGVLDQHRADLRATGVPLAGSYLQLVDDQPGGLGVIPLPHLDAGPFLSYGIQWIAFGIIAPIGVGYFVFAEVRQRRRERAETAARSRRGRGPATPLTTEEKLADRYGRRR